MYRPRPLQILYLLPTHARNYDKPFEHQIQSNLQKYRYLIRDISLSAETKNKSLFWQNSHNKHFLPRLRKHLCAALPFPPSTLPVYLLHTLLVEWYVQPLIFAFVRHSFSKHSSFVKPPMSGPLPFSTPYLSTHLPFDITQLDVPSSKYYKSILST